MKEYSFTVIFEPAIEGGFTVHIPALNIVTEGDTMDEADAMADDAIRGYLEVCREKGWEIPVETTPLEPVVRRKAVNF